MKKLLSILLVAAVLAGCGADWFPAFQVTPLSVSTTSLPAGVAGTAYTQQTLTATGGVSPYSWSVPANTLPAGLDLSSSGSITGTPTTAGSSTFTVTVSDASSPALTATKSLTISVTLPAQLSQGQTVTLRSGDSISVPLGTVVKVTGSNDVPLDTTSANPYHTGVGASLVAPATVPAGTTNITVTAP